MNMRKLFNFFPSYVSIPIPEIYEQVSSLH